MAMSDTQLKLLFVEDDAGLRRQLGWSFSDYEVLLAGDRPAAMDILRKDSPPVAVIDLGLPPDTQGVSEGLSLLESIRSESPRTKVIVMTGNEDRSNALRAIELGAYDFCAKPMDVDVLKLIIGRAQHLRQIEEELHQSRTAADDTAVEGVITTSPEMLSICRVVRKVAPTDVTVLLIGESGTGKEVLAHALHALSPRANKPFVAINCGAIPENLLESELFGHEKGSFTGAVKQTLGKVEVASGGTLFLDEIGDVPMPLQVKLLRFLQERVIERIGGRTTIPVDVRIVCATNQNLEELIQQGRFRGDLFYRLNEFLIKIPALRERRGDPLVLAHFFLNSFNAQFRRQVKGFTAEAKAAIAEHGWPGNVRELQSRMKRAILVTEGDLITPAELELGPTPDRGRQVKLMTLKEARTQAERQALLDVFAQVDGNVSQAAKILGISRPTLYDLLRQHNVKIGERSGTP
jgi:two-component system, NtrC family, response regulator